MLACEVVGLFVGIMAWAASEGQASFSWCGWCGAFVVLPKSSAAQNRRVSALAGGYLRLAGRGLAPCGVAGSLAECCRCSCGCCFCCCCCMLRHVRFDPTAMSMNKFTWSHASPYVTLSRLTSSSSQEGRMRRLLLAGKIQKGKSEKTKTRICGRTQPPGILSMLTRGRPVDFWTNIKVGRCGRSTFLGDGRHISDKDRAK